MTLPVFHDHSPSTPWVVAAKDYVVASNGTVRLEYAPKKGSLVIVGFTETTNPSPGLTEFYCDYQDVTDYRTAQQIVQFSLSQASNTVNIAYQGVSQTITAEHLNEIKTEVEASNAHINATSGAHSASAISAPATGTLTAGSVGSQLAELDTEKAPAGFGLGTYAKYLANTVDLSNIKSCGWYYADGCISRPVTELPSGYLLVHATNENYVLQEFTHDSTKRKFVRVSVNNVWSTWFEQGSDKAPSGFGLGTFSKALRIAGDDLNDIKAGGFYYAESNCANKPSATGGHVVVMAESSQYVVQIYYNVDATETYTRICFAGVWNSWRKIPKSVDITTFGTSRIGVPAAAGIPGFTANNQLIMYVNEASNLLAFAYQKTNGTVWQGTVSLGQIT